MLFSLEKRTLWVDLIAVCRYLKEASEKEGERVFTKACSDSTWSNDFKLKEGRFRLDIGKNVLQWDTDNETLVFKFWGLICMDTSLSMPDFISVT